MVCADIIKLQCVGSGDAFGSGGRLNSCYHIAIGDQQLLFDCGCSSLPGLELCGIKASDIDTIVVSHLHGDHFGGIPLLLLEGKYASKRSGELTLIGPPGLRKQVEATLNALYPGVIDDGFNFPIRYIELEPQKPIIGENYVLIALPVNHGRSEHVYGLRIEALGKVVSYTGDSEWTESIVTLSQGCDLLIAECFSYDVKVPSHLSYQTLLENRARLDCRRMVLTHMGPDMLMKVEQSEIEALNDGDILEI